MCRWEHHPTAYASACGYAIDPPKSGQMFNRVHRAGATGELVLRADSGFYNGKVTAACRKPDVRYSITVKMWKNLQQLIAAIPAGGWTGIPYYLDGGADVAEVPHRPFSGRDPKVRLIVRRVKPEPGSQLALFATYSYHAFITDRAGEMLLALEADHRRHAVTEDVIRDLKYGVGLNHLPSGRFSANAAWAIMNVLAHNLGRWTGRHRSRARGDDDDDQDATAPGCSTCRDGSPARHGTEPSTCRRAGRRRSSSPPSSPSCAP